MNFIYVMISLPSNLSGILYRQTNQVCLLTAILYRLSFLTMQWYDMKFKSSHNIILPIVKCCITTGDISIFAMNRQGL